MACVRVRHTPVCVCVCVCVCVFPWRAMCLVYAAGAHVLLVQAGTLDRLAYFSYSVAKTATRMTKQALPTRLTGLQAQQYAALLQDVFKKSLFLGPVHAHTRTHTRRVPHAHVTHSCAVMHPGVTLLWRTMRRAETIPTQPTYNTYITHLAHSLTRVRAQKCTQCVFSLCVVLC